MDKKSEHRNAPVRDFVLHNHAGIRTCTVRTRRQNYDYALTLLFPALLSLVSGAGQTASSCIRPHQVVTKMQQVLSRCTRLHRDASSCIEMHQAASR